MGKRKLFWLLALFIAPTVLASSGIAETRSYPVTDFNRIYFSGTGTVYISQGVQLSQDGATIVRAQGSRDTLNHLIVEVSDGVLFIESFGQESADLIVNLSIHELRELVSEGGVVVAESLKVGDLMLEGKGASSFRLEQLEADELQILGSGSTEFSLSGQVNRQVIELAGSGDYRARDLLSQSVEANVFGTGSVTLAVAEMLDIRVLGAARVSYVGSPYVSQEISGAGAVKQESQHSI
ncbi:MAG: DUF2807 domain-containing protein [Gammaproteobacteria bacterium]|nr:DUF2807 domain-containing protein [Gammaproteobacteria bacterium]MCZ6855656.1 DUF2807 domain-containing protein [Gammaproteobacteria bacterium]